jgi:hypothetical protein
VVTCATLLVQLFLMGTSALVFLPVQVSGKSWTLASSHFVKTLAAIEVWFFAMAEVRLPRIRVSLWSAALPDSAVILSSAPQWKASTSTSEGGSMNTS